MINIIEELKKMSQKRGYENKDDFQQLLERCKDITLSNEARLITIKNMNCFVLLLGCRI